MTEENELNRDDRKPPREVSAVSPKVVSTQELFAGEREICIEHEGEMYRLRITRRNKLILQK
ncbi:MAG: hemin uptake protein HemP [Gemmataceae bacterium]|nr:hemin uptake protein HemP [Gemmataceae bacterium]